MTSSNSLGDRECQEPCASKPLLEHDADRKPVNRPSIAEVGPEGSAEDKDWADLAASARAEWLARNPF